MQKYSKRQDEIINASIELIAERSIQELTIKNLSSRIGVTEAAIYRHFKSKIDILLAILQHFKTSTARILEQVKSEDMNPLDKIEFIFSNRFKVFKEKPSLAAVIFSEEIFQNDQRLSDIVHEIMTFSEDIIRNLIEQGQQDGSIRKDISKENLSTIIVGGLRLLVKRWRLSSFSFDLQNQGVDYIKAMRTMLANLN